MRNVMVSGERVLTSSERHKQPTFLNGHVTFVEQDTAYYIITIRYAGSVARENGIRELSNKWPNVYWEQRGETILIVELPWL